MWVPREGTRKVKRHDPVCSVLSKKRADHRNAILKDWALSIEPVIYPAVPDDYISPFYKDSCTFCVNGKPGRAGDEFRAITQRGRMNRVNCIPCCGKCNQSKSQKTGTELISWIHNRVPAEKFQIIYEWYKENEKYMLIPEDTPFPNKEHGTYQERLANLDNELNAMYMKFI